MANRDALEIVFQTGGEMFGECVFEVQDLTPEIEWPRKTAFTENTEFDTHQLEQYSKLLLNAARNTLEKHQSKKIGLALSGGVDSSLVLYLIKKVYPDVNIVAYHTDWKFPERSELAFAKMAAELTGTPLKVIDVSPSAQIPFIEKALSKCKTISYSGIPVYMAHASMVEDDVEIAVNALGLDELVAGYSIHRRYYNRRIFHFVPFMGNLMNRRYYRAAALRWGLDKAWFMTSVLPKQRNNTVIGSKVNLSDLYEKHIKGNNLWNTITNWTLESMVSNYANLISRPAAANGLEVLYPFMDRELMEDSFKYHPIAKENKAPVRALMRRYYHFPEDLAKRGEAWDKIGWGGTGLPYYGNKEYMAAIKPDKDTSDEWFTPNTRKYYQELETNPTVTGLHIAIFLKTLELI